MNYLIIPQIKNIHSCFKPRRVNIFNNSLRKDYIQDMSSRKVPRFSLGPNPYHKPQRKIQVSPCNNFTSSSILRSWSDTWRIALKKENHHVGKSAVWGSRVSFFKVSGVFLQLVLNVSDYTFNEFVWHSLEPCRDKQNQTKAAGTWLAALSLSLCYHPSKKLQEFKSRTCSKAFLSKRWEALGPHENGKTSRVA